MTVDFSDLDWIGRIEDYHAVRNLVTQTIANISAGQGTLDFAGAATLPKSSGPR